MIAIDTNLLVYAHRQGVPEHKASRRAIETAASSPLGWGIALPSLCEFWAVVTHRACSGGPSTPKAASGFIVALLRTGGGNLWLPSPGFPLRLLEAAQLLQLSGPRIFDLQIALISRESGATQIWTHDREFVSIPGFKVHDPLKK